VKFLLDTCFFSELIKPSPNPSVARWVAEQQAHTLFVSSITLAELERGVVRLASSRRKDELTRWLEQLKQDFEERILPFSRGEAETWAAVTTTCERQGRPLSALDSLIAATALANQCSLVTRNVRDFEATGVELICPWQ
jgi:toxin FitB